MEEIESARELQASLDPHEDVQSESEDNLVVRISPEKAQELYQKTRTGESATLVLAQTNISESHHYYPDYPAIFPVAEIERLGELDPALRDEFVKMLQDDQTLFREESRHRWHLERTGLYLGVSLAVVFGLFGLVALGMGSPWVSGTIFSTTVLGLLGILVLRKKTESAGSDEQE